MNDEDPFAKGKNDETRNMDQTIDPFDDMPSSKRAKDGKKRGKADINEDFETIDHNGKKTKGKKAGRKTKGGD
jgi:hypothetical protein